MKLIAAIIGRARRSGAHMVVGILAMLVHPAMAFAAGAEGYWWVHDKQARIRVVNCDGAIWGVISWEATPGMDSHNPDPAKRTRPMLGVPIILDMKADGTDKWSGSIYNSAFGQTVKGSVALTSADTLQITGCVLGILCGGEDWTRADMETSGGASNAQAPEAICKSVSAGL